MTATISADNGAGSTSPMTILSRYQSRRRSRSVIHDLIGGGLAVSLVAPRLRAGELELLYADEFEAEACAVLHSYETTYTLTDDDTPSVGMTYVVDGDVACQLDEDTLTLWVVVVSYQEVGQGQGAAVRAIAR